MSALKLLPNEILGEILSHLPRSDLVSTSRLSRRVNTISRPLLYTDPDLISPNQGSTSSIILFLRTMLSPGGNSLANCVRSVHLKFGGSRRTLLTNRDDDDDNDDKDTDSGPAHQQQNDLNVVVAAATRLGYANHNDPGTQIVLLLYLLRRLHTVSITTTAKRTTLSAAVIENQYVQIDTLPLGLQELREFRCFLHEQRGRLSAGALLIVLGLPQIQKVEVRLSDESTFDFNTVVVAPGSSTVTDLRFSLTFLTEKSLEYLLRIPAALEYLSYSGYTFHFSLDMGPALQLLKMSLKHLHIRYVRVTKSIGSLRDWPVLQTLRISLKVLLGQLGHPGTLSLVDALPAGLRQFHIQQEGFWPVAAEVDQVLELLGRKTTVLPVLETLLVAMSGGSKPIDEENKTRLTIACQVAGVELLDGDLVTSMD